MLYFNHKEKKGGLKMTNVMPKNSYEVSIEGAKRFVADFAVENGFTCFPYFGSDDYIASLDPRVFEVLVSEARIARVDDISKMGTPDWVDMLLFMNLRSTEDRMRKGFVPDINEFHELVGWVH